MQKYMLNRSFFPILALLFALVVQTGCKKDDKADPNTVYDKDYFVSAELLTHLPAFGMKALAASQGYNDFVPDLKYDVSVYKVTYLTSYRNQEIQASGLICVPLNVPGKMPTLSAQHGTIFANSDAPTSFSNNFSGFELFASAGYVTLVPDYIGYGVSKDIFHPYYDQKHSALAVVDFIKASKSFARKFDLDINNKLFLTGYSEGGYVTLAAQKEIETNPAHKLHVTASAAGAGGYDLTDMLAQIASGEPYKDPAYLAFILQSFNYTNGWNRPLNDLFAEPYASRLPGLFDGTKGGGHINSQLSRDPFELFNPTFYSNLRGDGEAQFKQAIIDNSILNWAPKSPTRMYHGTADETVPFRNSQVTYDKYKAGGAASLEFFPVEGGTHSTSLVPMVLSIVPWIKSFNK